MWILGFLLCPTTAVPLPAQTFTTLYSFGGADGGNPGGLIQATDGNFYGTTAVGGTSDNCYGGGCGTVFRMTPGGVLTTLYSFCVQSGCPDGLEPYARLVQATDGNLYGTTELGGANFCVLNGSFTNGCGTVFKITPGGTLTTLYSFCAQGGTECLDGYYPNAGLVQATDGNFYGTTGLGGGNGGGPGVGFPGRGTVFKITPSGTLTTLYSFCVQSGCPDGYSPVAGLVRATDGNFYGTTELGGGNTYGGGTVFKITPSGTLTTLYSFCAQGAPYCTDGSDPVAGLVQATNGNFYGTTASGGAINCSSGSGCGTVFKMTRSGTLTTMYSFCAQSGCPDGHWPNRLVPATDWNLYGTTIYGGAYNYGTVFKITPSGALTTLYSFCAQSGCPDGDSPSAGVVQGTNGSLYGTTSGGGASGDGTIFSLSVGPSSSVPAVNAGGVLNSASYTTQGVAPGSIVSIFGTNLAASAAGANAIPLPTALSDVTSVTLNNISAGLYFVSQNQINAQLPFNVLPSGQDSGTVNIVITRSIGTSAPENVTVVPVSPGIFTTTANGIGQAFAYDNTTGALAAPAGAGSFTTTPISISSKHALIVACTGLGSVTPSIDD